LWAKRKHFKVKRSSALKKVHQGCEEGNKYRFHTGNATWALTEKSIKSMSMEFLVGTGVTKPGGDPIDDEERLAYSVTVDDGTGNPVTITPFAIADLGDGDNNHELCLDVETPAIRVDFPVGLLTDPREDLNPATGISVTGAGVSGN
jgi:hypothetical protein